MRAYELMIIFRVDTEESEIQTTINKLGDLAKQVDGTLENIDKWGIKKFAYEMKKQREGFYVVLEFISPNILAEVDRTLRLDDQVLRHKFIRLPLGEAHRRGFSMVTS